MKDVMHEQLLEWFDQTGKLIETRIKEGLAVEEKTSLSDVVTNVDKEIEQSFAQFLQTNYPTHRLLGEEAHQQTDFKGDVWVIDPIDGTLNFVVSQTNYAVMLSLFTDKVCQRSYIFDVYHKELYYAKKGEGVYCNGKKLAPIMDAPLFKSVISVTSNIQKLDELGCLSVLNKARSVRMIGSCSCAMLHVIRGQYGAYISAGVCPWDYLPGILFAQELGICYSDLNGQALPFEQTSTFLFAIPTVHQEILTVLSSYKA